MLDFVAKRVEIKGDSELVVKKLTKEYISIKENLIMYFVIANRLIKCFDFVDIQHVPRLVEIKKENELAQIASIDKVSKKKLKDLIEVIRRVKSTKLSHSDLITTKLRLVDPENFEIFPIENLTDIDWRRTMVEYLENPTGSTNRKIKYKYLSYVIIGNELFKKTPKCILLKCLGENEAYLAISNVHSRSCGAHQVGNKMICLLC